MFYLLQQHLHVQQHLLPLKWPCIRSPTSLHVLQGPNLPPCASVPQPPAAAAVTKYAGLKNALRCYHQVQMPAGIVAVGDAVLELNPVVRL